jgi:hypothetical protein
MHQTPPAVVDIASRPGLAGQSPTLLVRRTRPTKAAVILLAGGHGGFWKSEQLTASLVWGNNSFLVRTRRLLFQSGGGAAGRTDQSPITSC